MKIDLDCRLTDFNGVVIDGVPPLRDVIVRALVEVTQEELQSLTGEMKFSRALLAQKIATSDSPDLTVEELSLIKARIGALYAPMTVLWAWNAIDGR